MTDVTNWDYYSHAGTDTGKKNMSMRWDHSEVQCKCGFSFFLNVISESSAMTVRAKNKGCSTPAGNVNTCWYLPLIAGRWLKPYQTHADLPNQSTPFNTLFSGTASLPVIFNPNWLCSGFYLSQTTADLKVPCKSGDLANADSARMCWI